MTENTLLALWRLNTMLWFGYVNILVGVWLNGIAAPSIVSEYNIINLAEARNQRLEKPKGARL